MKRVLTIALIAVMLFAKSTRADEGMWLPFLLKQINYAEMKKMGLELTPEQLYSINQPSLKDAIVMLDGGSCTGEIVSKQGLLFTNHHCGYDNIQFHSTVEHDYLTDGFWAKSFKEELPNPGKTASFLKRVEDVTNRIMKKVRDDMTEGERDEAIRNEAEEIVKEAEDGSHYNAEVLPMFNGNKYLLFVYETFTDVRLVGAPPTSIGEFGGDTDNWMWPRHTGDFAIFRVYSGPDGKPAEYSEDNIPLQTDYFLPISLKGIEKSDFAMIWGYPGTTDRYLTSYGVNFNLEHFNPAIIEAGNAIISNMKIEMGKSDEVRIQYAAKHKMVANFSKLYEGQSQFLKVLNVADDKVELEKEFQNWIAEKAKRNKIYRDVLDETEKYYKLNSEHKFNIVRTMNFLLSFFGVESIGVAQRLNRLKIMMNDGEDYTAFAEQMKQAADHIYKDYYYEVDKLNLASLLEIYKKHIPLKFHPTTFAKIDEEFNGSFTKYADHAFNNTIFKNKESYLSFLENPSVEVLTNDPIFQLALAMEEVGGRAMGESRDLTAAFQKTERLFLKGLLDMQGENSMYPDANSTMRFTYGNVIDLKPRDAVHYDYKTFLKGAIEKEDPSNPEFIVPERLIEIYNTKDYGRYGVGDKMPSCFLTNNDITGGNSGSPVINGKGELIGIAFDSNWEGVSGDIAFNPEKQRCVNVDIRYVLMVIDKFAGATNLIEELKIVE